MNIKLLIIISIIVLIIGLGAYGFQSMQDKSKTTNPEVIQDDAGTNDPKIDSSSPTVPSMAKSSLLGLFSSNKMVKCSFTTDSEVNTSGTVYVSGKRARAITNVITGGLEIESNMYTDGNKIYIWGSKNSSGIVMDIGELKSFGSEQAQSDSIKKAQFDAINKDLNVDCSPWQEDASLLSVPDNVKFSNLSKVIENVNSELNPMDGSNSDIINNACKVCETLTGLQKTKCLTSLKCK